MVPYHVRTADVAQCQAVRVGTAAAAKPGQPRGNAVNFNTDAKATGARCMLGGCPGPTPGWGGRCQPSWTGYATFPVPTPPPLPPPPPALPLVVLTEWAAATGAACLDPAFYWGWGRQVGEFSERRRLLALLPSPCLPPKHAQPCPSWGMLCWYFYSAQCTAHTHSRTHATAATAANLATTLCSMHRQALVPPLGRTPTLNTPPYNTQQHTQHRDNLEHLHRNPPFAHRFVVVWSGDWRRGNATIVQRKNTSGASRRYPLLPATTLATRCCDISGYGERLGRGLEGVF